MSEGIFVVSAIGSSDCESLSEQSLNETNAALSALMYLSPSDDTVPPPCVDEQLHITAIDIIAAKNKPQIFFIFITVLRMIYIIELGIIRLRIIESRL